MKTSARAFLPLVLVLAACAGAATNPDRSKLAPVANVPKPAPEARVDAGPAAPPSAKPSDGAKPPAEGAPAKSVAEASAGESASTPGPSAPKRLDPPSLPVAFVDGRALDVRRFLARVWIRDSTFAREVLDQLVVSELAIREGDRLGIQVDPARVDAGVQRALDALTRRLADKGSKLSVEEHVKQNLGLDFALYRAELERDTVMQLVAERAVRATALASERAVVRLAELPDRAALERFQAELSAGGDFKGLVQQHGTEEIKKSGEATMTLFQNDQSKLSRLAFATPVGTVGGPLEEGGRYLLVRVEERLAPRSGPWTEIGAEVESSLVTDPVDDLEYAQWKIWVGKVYDVDLAPFLELVGEKRP